MATFDPVVDFGYYLVAVAPSPALSGTQMTLQQVGGSPLPDPVTQGEFNLTVYPPNTGPLLSNAEFIRVTLKAGDVIDFDRAQAPTSAMAIAVGWQVALTPSALTMQQIFDAINAIPSGPTGPTGPTGPAGAAS